MASLFVSGRRLSSVLSSLSHRNRAVLRWSSNESKEITMKGGGLTEYVNPESLVKPKVALFNDFSQLSQTHRYQWTV